MDSKGTDSYELDLTLQSDFTRGSRRITSSRRPFDVPITEFSQKATSNRLGLMTFIICTWLLITANAT